MYHGGFFFPLCCRILSLTSGEVHFAMMLFGILKKIDAWSSVGGRVLIAVCGASCASR